MRGFQRVRRKPFPRRTRKAPERKKRPGFLRRYARWLVVPGAILAAASFFAKDVYQESLNSSVEELERQIDASASPDELPLSAQEDSAMKVRCKPLLTTFDKPGNANIEDCSSALLDLYRKGEEVVAGTDNLQALIVLPTDAAENVRQIRSSADGALGVGIGLMGKCDAFTGSILQTLEVAPDPVVSHIPCVKDAPYRSYLAVSRGYSIALGERRVVVEKAKDYLHARQHQSDRNNAFVICLFVIGWTAHLTGSFLGVRIEGGE
jgi:hypothetical protein